MKALILGAGGQVGRALVATAPLDVDVVALTRAQCDVTEPAAIAAALGRVQPAFVFNAAAYTAVDRAESEPDAAHLLNAWAPGRIAEATREAGARMVHISTDFVFDGTADRPYRPDDATSPLGVYGATKREGEEAVLAADPAALVVRTAWVYDSEGSNFVRTMLRLMAERDRLTVVADQHGTPTWASSLASALWSLAGADATGLHHFTDDGEATWHDFAVAIAEEGRALGLLDREVEIVPIATADYPTPACRPAYSVLDKTATWAELPAPPPHWRVNLRTCLKEIAAHG